MTDLHTIAAGMIVTLFSFPSLADRYQVPPMGGLSDEADLISISYSCQYENRGVAVRGLSKSLRCHFNAVSLDWADPKEIDRDVEDKAKELDDAFRKATPDEIDGALRKLKDQCEEVRTSRLLEAERTRLSRNSRYAAIQPAADSEAIAFESLCACTTGVCINEAIKKNEVQRLRSLGSTCSVHAIAWSTVFQAAGGKWVSNESDPSQCYQSETLTLYQVDDGDKTLFFPEIWRGSGHWNLKVTRIAKPGVDATKCRWDHKVKKGDHSYTWKPSRISSRTHLITASRGSTADPVCDLPLRWTSRTSSGKLFGRSCPDQRSCGRAPRAAGRGGIRETS